MYLILHTCTGVYDGFRPRAQNIVYIVCLIYYILRFQLIIIIIILILHCFWNRVDWVYFWVDIIIVIIHLYLCPTYDCTMDEIWNNRVKNKLFRLHAWILLLLLLVIIRYIYFVYVYCCSTVVQCLYPIAIATTHYGRFIILIDATCLPSNYHCTRVRDNKWCIIVLKCI